MLMLAVPAVLLGLLAVTGFMIVIDNFPIQGLASPPHIQLPLCIKLTFGNDQYAWFAREPLILTADSSGAPVRSGVAPRWYEAFRGQVDRPQMYGKEAGWRFAAADSIDLGWHSGPLVRIPLDVQKRLPVRGRAGMHVLNLYEAVLTPGSTVTARAIGCPQTASNANL